MTRTARSYTRWNPERDGELIYHYTTRRASREEIAQVMGLSSWAAVRSRLNVLGIRRGWHAGEVVRVRGHEYKVTAVTPEGDAVAVSKAGAVRIISRNGLQPLKVPERPTTPRVRLRCIGPGAEHFFDSPDKRTVRMCDRCRRKT